MTNLSPKSLLKYHTGCSSQWNYSVFFLGGARNANISQDVAIPGLANRWVPFSFYARRNSAEPLLTNTSQKVEARIWWMNGASLVDDLRLTLLQPVFSAGTLLQLR